MAKDRFRNAITGIFAVMLLTACAAHYQPVPTIEPQPLKQGQYNKKADRLVLVLDASSSMAKGYQAYQKMEIARSVLENFNSAMPDTDIIVSLHSFGHDPMVAYTPTVVQLPPAAYDRGALASALARYKVAGGFSPLAQSLMETAAELKKSKDRIAVVIVSDGEDMAAGTLAAAKALVADHGERLCIYTVQVGNAADGKMLLGQMAALTSCGQAVAAESLMDGKAVRGFVEDVLFTKKRDRDGDGVADNMDRCPGTPRGVPVDHYGCPLDSDGDGVPDYKDKCPDTPRGTKVDASGCPLPVATKSAEVTAAGTWRYKDIQFETSSATLKQSSFPTLNEIVQVLQANPDLKIEIQGHTDGSGARAYNVALSQKRAESVMAYLKDKGIAAQRMTARGFGPDRPIESNATREGRARNRRVEIKPIE